MPFSAITSYPSDKSTKMFNQNVDELGSDFFDQFLNFSSLESENTNYSILPESPCMYTSDNHLGRLSSTSAEEERHMSLWAGESWILSQNDLSPPRDGKRFYTELSGRAAISDSELISLENIGLKTHNASLHMPSSLSPSRTATAAVEKQRRKDRIVAKLSKTFKKAHKSLDTSPLRSPIKKMNNSPKASCSHQSDHTALEAWKRITESNSTSFTSEFPENNLPLSPPPSAKVSDASMNSKRANKGQPNGLGNRTPSAQSMHQQIAYHTPVGTPRLNAQQEQRKSNLHRSDIATFPSTYQPLHGGNSWTPSTVYPAEVESPLWWSHAASSPTTQPSPSLLHSNPQQSKALTTQLQNNVAYHHHNNESELAFNPMSIDVNPQSGLMIQMPPSNTQQPYLMSAPTIVPQQSGYFPPQHHSTVRNTRSQQQQKTSSRRKHRTPSPSSDSASPSSPSLGVRKRKSRKNSGARHSGAVDFVNFTPDDSRKILTGVAPSGSSKTKARREKEAEEKRRKLSQAALRAVRAAGGDVESLVEEGLFV